MGLTFQEHWNELRVWVPDLPPQLAQRLVNRALRSIYRARPWSFLTAAVTISVPAEVNSGAVAVTRNSDTVTPDATALTALTGLSGPVITLRQFRVSTGPIYNIQAFDGSVLTLDRPYAEATQAATSYAVYQCYFHVPADFSHWTSIVDRENAFSLQLGVESRRLDIWDPMRATSGIPYIQANYRAVPAGYWDATYPAGRPMFELWPHQRSAKVYPALYVREGADLAAAADTLPSVISDELLQARARVMAYEWKMASGGSGILDLRSAYQLAQTQYREALRDARKIDDEWAERNIVAWLRPGHYISGAAYRQAHDLPAL